MRAIEKGAKEIGERLGVQAKRVVVTVNELGNTASTTHFVALRKYLGEGRFEKGQNVMLISFASGLEVGVLIFPVEAILERYGNED